MNRIQQYLSRVKSTRKLKNTLKRLRNLNVLNNYKQYSDEVEKSGIISYIKDKKLNFEKSIHGITNRGNQLDFGGLGYLESKILYSIIRSNKPDIVLETGVCNGVSSAIILSALNVNKKGKLISIDLPEVEGTVYRNGFFWEGKGGAAIPKDKQPGWIIPENLRNRWELSLGRSQSILPIILDSLKDVDIFIHDSEHSYECMSFEYEAVFPKLTKGGLLISDDVNWNDAFIDFSNKFSLKPYFISEHLGIIVKP